MDEARCSTSQPRRQRVLIRIQRKLQKVQFFTLGSSTMLEDIAAKMFGDNTGPVWSRSSAWDLAALLQRISDTTELWAPTLGQPCS